METDALIPFTEGVPSGHPEDVTHVTAERNYVRVHLRNGVSTRLRGLMEQWQHTLPEKHFARLGRSVIVNLDAVQRVHRVARDLSLVTMLNSPRPLRLGRKASMQLRHLLSSAQGNLSTSDSSRAAMDTQWQPPWRHDTAGFEKQAALDYESGLTDAESEDGASDLTLPHHG